MSEHHLRHQTEELWRETLRDELLHCALRLSPAALRILNDGVRQNFISREAANEIIAALGVG